MTDDNIIELTIDALAYGGEGVARHDGKVYFVFGALPGETVKARLTQEKKSFNRAETVEVVKASPDRVEPPCAYFGECGGCQLQHLNYHQQIVWKEKWLKDLIDKIGHISEISVEPLQASPREYEYRNRISLTVSQDRKGSFRQGFLSRDNKSLVPISGCSIAHSSINQFMKEVAEKRLFPEIVGPHLRHKLKLDIVTNEDEVLILPWRKVQEKRKSRYTFKEDEILTKKVGQYQFCFSPHVFFQTNFYLTPQLLTTVERFLFHGKEASPSEESALFDLYSGVGLFGISLSPYVKKVVGLEENKGSHQYAIHNIKKNKIENVLAYSGKVERQFPKLFERHKQKNNYVIVDPPRQGLEADLVEAIKTLKEDIRSMVYISCEPSILARDLDRLKEAGFHPKQIAPFDLFPQTKFFETIVLLEKS